MPNLNIKYLGVAPDLESWDQGNSWSSCQNMRFSTGRSERIRGYDDTGLVTQLAPSYLQNYYDISSNYWLVATATGVDSWDGAAGLNVVTPIGYGPLTDPGQWTGTRGPFLNYLILNTVEDAEPYVWDATAPTTAMLAYPNPALGGHVAPNATCLRSLFNTFLFCLDTADDASGNWDATPQTIVWSDSTTGALPTFLPAAGNRAGSTTLATSTPLVDCIQLRDSALVFSSTDVFRIDFIGGQEVFRFSSVPGPGLLARNCLCEMEGLVYYLSVAGEIMITDGTTTRTIDDRVNRTILGSLADDARGSWVAANPLSREVWFCPLTVSATAPRSAWTLDIDSGAIGQRSLPDPASGGTTFGQAGVNSQSADDSWNATLPTDTWTDGRAIAWNFRESTPGAQVLFVSTLGDNIYRADVNVEIQSGTLSREGIVPDPESDGVFLCRRVWVDGVLPGNGLQITVGARYDDSSPYRQTNIILQPGERSAPLIAKGRQFSLRLQSFSDPIAWSVSRVNIEFSDAASRF